MQAALGGRYRVEREVGRGGMATVYLAHDLKHDRPVALKVLHPELSATLGPERFQREIRVAAQLQHPQIVPVYDSGADAGLLWFTMPYVEGRTLRDRLRRGGPLPIDEVVRILAEIARALAYAHRAGVIHRDLKPENVLIGPDNVFLADFGIAKPLRPGTDPSLTATGAVLGTATYMAPEQAMGDREIDHRVDIYAFGVVAYELLAGQPPFTNLSLGELLVAHVTREPEPLAARRPDVPAWLETLVARCLRKAPDERWSSADALSAALQAGGSTESTTVSARGDLEQGRAAFARAAWREAYERLARADAAEPLEPDDLARLAEAAWWVAKGPECVRARERAYRAYAQRNDHRAAAAAALALAEDHFHRLARSVGQGWLRRAERHLADLPEVAEHGWLCRLRTILALEAERRLDEAMTYAERTIAIARRVGDTNLEMLALQDRGRILVALGRVADGMALLDESMTAATAGELTPRTTGRAYCNMMSTCDRLGDIGRAAEWYEAARRWCEPHAESGYPGMCRVHRAGILRLRGALPEAEQEARRAAEQLEHFLADVAGEAFYELGEIRLRMGDLQTAGAMFAEAHAHGRDPQPGLALLRLAEGNREAARSMIERSLAEPELGPLDRAKLLPRSSTSPPSVVRWTPPPPGRPSSRRSARPTRHRRSSPRPGSRTEPSIWRAAARRRRPSTFAAPAGSGRRSTSPSSWPAPGCSCPARTRRSAIPTRRSWSSARRSPPSSASKRERSARERWAASQRSAARSGSPAKQNGQLFGKSRSNARCAASLNCRSGASSPV